MMKAFSRSLTFYLLIATATKSFAVGSDSKHVVVGTNDSRSEVSGVRGGHGALVSLRWGDGGGGGSSCSGEQTIPFMVTNVELTQDGDEYYSGYHSDNFEEEFKFLKDIRYCPDAGRFSAYRVYGTLISAEDFKQEVSAYVDNSSDYDSLLYFLHGVDNDPGSSFNYAYNFLNGNGADTNILLIPINWRSRWGLSSNYDWDRNNSAPRAGRQLAAQYDVFLSSTPTSIVCHSMGNYVFRLMAQNIENPVQAFNNVYMVAADARMDMFGTEFNPAAPRDAAGEGGADVTAPAAQNYLDIPDSELEPNGGYAITLVAGHVRVIWNRGDHALLIREGFQIGWGSNVRKALGKYGDQSEELMTLPYFKERVTFYDFSATIEEIGVEHSYVFADACVAVYADHKAEELAEKEKQSDLQIE